MSNMTMTTLIIILIVSRALVLITGQNYSESGLKLLAKFNSLEKKLSNLLLIPNDDLHHVLEHNLDLLEKVLDSYKGKSIKALRVELDNMKEVKGVIDTDYKLDIGPEIENDRHKRQVDYAALGFDLESTCENETMPVFFKMLQIERGIKINGENIDKIVSLDLKGLADSNKLNKENIEEINANVNHIKQTVDLLLNFELYKMKTCSDLQTFGDAKSGVYRIFGKRVYCDQETDGGGWLVFQRRMDGSENFYRNWNEYKEGFGDLEGEFWLGNKYLSEMTDIAIHGWQELRIDMVAVNGEKHFAKYAGFRVMSEADGYRMFAFGFRGDVGDGLYKDSGKHFCTMDNDNDRSNIINCAEQYKGGWWYSDCYSANLNGVYYDHGADTTARDGIEWVAQGDDSLLLKFVEMKFRRNRGYL